VTTDGKIKPCLHSDFEIDILKLREEGLTYLQILEKAIGAKPERHLLEDNEKQMVRNMNEIGG
jgi:cyclic pyranopterin phosphate synthase